LEAYFGQPLFDRSARTVKPTAFALEAAALARDFSARLKALRARASVAVQGRVRLGAIASVQTDALPRALRSLRDQYPALEVGVVLHDSDALQVELKAGRIDMAVLIRPQSGGSSRLAWQNLAKQRYVMLVPPGEQAASPQEVLQRLDLLRYDPSLTGGRIAAQYVRQAFPRARYAMDVRSIDALVAMVSAGLGAAVVPQPRQALLDAHGVRAMRLGRRVPMRQIAAVRRGADVDNRNLDAVAQALTAVYAAGDCGRP
jgi:DNA-binding transcriptional LysR family regulator